eukprot:6729837-Pyramimonas_sp.AAC.1
MEEIKEYFEEEASAERNRKAKPWQTDVERDRPLPGRDCDELCEVQQWREADDVVENQHWRRRHPRKSAKSNIICAQ